MKSRLLLVVTVLVSVTFSSCEKWLPKKKNENCDKISVAKIEGAKAVYNAGEEIRLSTVEGTNIFHHWSHSNVRNDLGHFSSVTVTATKDYQGWFYVVISTAECEPRYDSVYVEVRNAQVAAPCAPANNTVSFSSIPDISCNSVTFGMHPTYDVKELRGYQAQGYPDISIYFHDYWDDKEPEDGEYSLHNTFSFSGTSVYNVYMTSLYSGLYMVANSPGKVYVSHVNGKLRVTFCNITFSGSMGGPTYTTTGTGRITAP